MGRARPKRISAVRVAGLAQIEVRRLLGVEHLEEVGAAVVGADDVRGGAVLGFPAFPELGEEVVPQPLVDGLPAVGCHRRLQELLESG
jgi:hypothetical protein